MTKKSEYKIKRLHLGRIYVSKMLNYMWDVPRSLYVNSKQNNDSFFDSNIKLYTKSTYYHIYYSV